METAFQVKQTKPQTPQRATPCLSLILTPTASPRLSPRKKFLRIQVFLRRTAHDKIIISRNENIEGTFLMWLVSLETGSARGQGEDVQVGVQRQGMEMDIEVR